MNRIISGHWLPIKDGDPRASYLYKRHYSCKDYQDRRRYQTNNPNRHLIAGPGQKIVLLTIDGRALFVWRKFIDGSGQTGVNCAVFRNEGDVLSSVLILEAEQLAWRRWPGERLYTYVDPKSIRSTNPGACFKFAGWHECGRSQDRGLVILEKWPEGQVRQNGQRTATHPNGR